VADLGHQNVSTVDRDLLPRARGSNERRRTRTVNQIDHNGIVIHRLKSRVVERGPMIRNAIPEQYPLLRTIQMTHAGYCRAIQSAQ